MLFALFDEFGLAEGLLLGFGLLLLAGLLLFWFRPFLLVRIPLWILAHTVYRLRVRGVENILATGQALLVCNHVSYFDVPAPWQRTSSRRDARASRRG